MDKTEPNATGIGFWQLAFSAPGATIAICVAIVVVAVIVYLLSRRFPQISLQYGSSKLELRRDLIPTDTKPTQIGVASDLPIATEAEKGAASAITGADSQEGKRYFALTEAVEKQDRPQIEKIFESFRLRPIGYAPYQLEVWENVELLRAGFADARIELERIERENPKDSDASLALARYYLGIRAAEEARIHIEILLTRADSDEKLTAAMLLKSSYIESLEDRDAAIKYLLSAANKISQLQSQSKIYEALGDRYRDQKRDGLAIAAYERALACDVHNKDARFQLAYIYAQNDALQSLSLRHYRILLRQDPRYWSAENNLGVVYEKLGLKLHKIEAWQSAAERNDGYSVGNLMFAYLETGFVEKAEKVYEEAASHVKSNPRVIAAYTQLKGIRDQENERLDQVREDGEAIWRELTKGNISFEKAAEDWIGDWKESGGASVMKVTRSGEFLQIEVFEDSITRKGFAKTSEGVTVVSVTQEDKTQGLVSVLMSGGSRGQFLMFPMEHGLKIIHVTSDNKVMSARIYNRVGQAPLNT
ncbi:MAG TPA: tetratricopeptide repeat protein [Xanthobacteraceae bacterium]|nr:tetratricopeptide repeat protein [Xanthobacteraceae bacterium]